MNISWRFFVCTLWGVCPLFNLLQVLAVADYYRKRIIFAISIILVITEIAFIGLFFNDLVGNTNTFIGQSTVSFVLNLTLTISWLYSTYVFFKIPSSDIIILSTSVGYYLSALKPFSSDSKNHFNSGTNPNNSPLSKIIETGSTIILTIAFVFIICLKGLSDSILISDIFLKTVSLLYLSNISINFLSLAQENIITLLPYQSVQANQNTTQTSSPKIVATKQEQDKPVSAPSFDKGWTVDDTLRMEVNLTIIEDIINPLSLKNEYEKSTKDLILYIRKLEKHRDIDIENALGKDGLSGYLNTFFEKMEFDAVRLIFLRSLSLVIENYAKRDTRIVVYQQKMLTIVQNRVQ